MAPPQVALWAQNSARAPGAPVLWDYHVVLALRRVAGCGVRGAHEQEADDVADDDAAWIYDFDSACVPRAPTPALGEPIAALAGLAPADHLCLISHPPTRLLPYSSSYARIADRAPLVLAANGRL
jgi:hypothetical protein